MNNRIWIVILIITTILSLKIGIHLGQSQFELYDSPYKAYVTAIKLKKLKSNDLTLVQAINEGELTQQIVNYGKSLKHGIPWIFWPINRTNKNNIVENSMTSSDFMATAIEYRKKHPVEINLRKSDLTYYEYIIENK